MIQINIANEALYMTLKKMGVPTEFIVYPNMRHNISDMRYQIIKMPNKTFQADRRNGLR